MVTVVCATKNIIFENIEPASNFCAPPHCF